MTQKFSQALQLTDLLWLFFINESATISEPIYAFRFLEARISFCDDAQANELCLSSLVSPVHYLLLCLDKNMLNR